MSQRYGEQWDEQGWEAELRQEDARMRAYLAELPQFIDLPGENDLLGRRMARHPELVPELQSWRMTMPEQDGDPEEDADFSFPADWRRRPVGELYNRLQVGAQGWCRIFSSRLDRATRAEGVEIIAAFGLLQGMVIDLIYMGDDEPSGLRLALLKRLHAGINRLCGRLQAVGRRHSELNASCQELVRQLEAALRLVTDLLLAARGTAAR